MSTKIRSKVRNFFNGFKTAPLVWEVKWFENVRERGVVAANPLDRSLQREEAGLLYRGGDLRPEAACVGRLVRNDAPPGLLHRAEDGPPVPGQDRDEVDNLHTAT